MFYDKMKLYRSHTREIVTAANSQSEVGKESECKSIKNNKLDNIIENKNTENMFIIFTFQDRWKYYLYRNTLALEQGDCRM